MIPIIVCRIEVNILRRLCIKMGIPSPRQSWASNTHQQGACQLHPNSERVNAAWSLYSQRASYTTPSSRYFSSFARHLETEEGEQTKGRRRVRDPRIFESIDSRLPYPPQALCTQRDESSSGKQSLGKENEIRYVHPSIENTTKDAHHETL